MASCASSRRCAPHCRCRGSIDHVVPERNGWRVHQAGGSYMTSQTKLLFASPLLLAFACGDLKSPTAAVGHVSYKTNGDIAAFLPRDLVTMDGQLAAEKERVPFVGPPAGANI